MVSAGSSYDYVPSDHTFGSDWCLVSCDRRKEQQTFTMKVCGGTLFRHVFNISPVCGTRGQVMAFVPDVK